MKQCPDYDADCLDVKNPLSCWMGHAEYFAADVLMTFSALPVAGGFCPLVKATQREKRAMTMEEINMNSENKDLLDLCQLNLMEENIEKSPDRDAILEVIDRKKQDLVTKITNQSMAEEIKHYEQL